MNKKKYVYNYLISKGLTPTMSAGIVGNLAIESGNFDENVINFKRTGDQGTAFGVAQWRGNRKENLEKFAGDRAKTLEGQLDFLIHELQTEKSNGLSELQRARSVEEATHIFMNKFERPNRNPKINLISDRVKEANQFANESFDTDFSQSTAPTISNLLPEETTLASNSGTNLYVDLPEVQDEVVQAKKDILEKEIIDKIVSNQSSVQLPDVSIQQAPEEIVQPNYNYLEDSSFFTLQDEPIFFAQDGGFFSKKDNLKVVNSNQLPLDKLIQEDKKVRNKANLNGMIRNYSPKLVQDNTDKTTDSYKEDQRKKARAYSGAIIEKRKEDAVNDVLIPLAEVASSVGSLGNFIPHPMAQTIGKVSSVIGTAIDTSQSISDFSEGDIQGGIINGLSVIAPSLAGMKTFKRNSKYIKDGDFLSGMRRKITPTEYERVNYLNVDKQVRGQGKGGLLANRTLLGATVAEGAYDFNEGFINKSGYLKGKATENNPYNIIPSNNITMEGVEYPVIGIPLDSNYKPIGEPTIMNPNKKYNFKNAKFVLERPLK